VFRVAGKFFRQRSQVEDAAQEVFLKAFVQLGSYEGRGPLEGWLTRTATDLSEEENYWLDEKLSNLGTEQHNSAEQKLVAADLADRLLGSLSPEDRLTLTLIDGEDDSIKEVAETTGWSESKVKVRAFRARKKVREAMEKLLGRRGAKSGLDLVHD
jgi:RNA polymerase sigma-70 factor (ECF subfamily)